MRTIQKIKRLFWIASGLLLIMSVSILFMPLATEISVRTKNISLIAAGGAFWISFFIGYALIIRADYLRRWFIHNQLDDDVKVNCRSGILTFFSNTPAVIADSVMITSFVVTVIIMFTALRNNYIVYVLLFLLTFSLNMHCMFNGRIYQVTKFKQRIRREEYHG